MGKRELSLLIVLEKGLGNRLDGDGDSSSSASLSWFKPITVRSSMKSHLLNLSCCNLIVLFFAVSRVDVEDSLSLFLLYLEDHPWSVKTSPVFWPLG